MIGWYLLGRRRGRKRAEADLDAQAERQRRRAPEPGPDEPEVLVEEESEILITRASLYDYRKLRRWLLLPMLLLGLAGAYINPWIFWIAPLPFFFFIGFVVQAFEDA